MKIVNVPSEYLELKKRITIKELRGQLMDKHPFCYWCGGKVKSYPEFYNNEMKKGFKWPEDMATIDHLFSRWEPEKRYQAYLKSEDKVLACFRCNSERARKENKKFKVKNYKIKLVSL